MPQAWQDHDNSVRPYLRAHLALNLPHKAVSLGITAYLLLSSTGREWDYLANGYIRSPLAQWLAYFGLVAVIYGLAGFPFSVAGWQVERRFGLSKQKFGSWMADQLKGMALGLILGTVILSALHFIVMKGGASWWAWAGLFFFAFSVLLAQLAPLLIPLFFKLKPMATSPLKTRLLALCEGQGVKVDEVFHLGLGEKTEKGNAAFVGLGKTKKILIGDTLYEKYSEDQIEAVFAHELGHQVNNDIWRNIILSGLLTFGVFFVANWICDRWVLPFYSTTVARPFGLYVFFVVFSLCQYPVNLLMTMHSRARERMADRFADKLDRSKPLAQALERLTMQNKGLFRPHPIVEFFKHSHPAPWRRIHPRLY